MYCVHINHVWRMALINCIITSRIYVYIHTHINIACVGGCMCAFKSRAQCALQALVTSLSSSLYISPPPYISISPPSLYLSSPYILNIYLPLYLLLPLYRYLHFISLSLIPPLYLYVSSPHLSLVFSPSCILTLSRHTCVQCTAHNY